MNDNTHSENYDVESILGKGGMGVVYLAHDKRLNRKVAIKCIRQNRANPMWVQAVQEEAKLLAQINHSNIVQIYDLIDWQGTPALVMEYVQGRTLLDYLCGPELKAGELSFSQRKHWLLQIALGLDCAHRKGIIHRDLKPENIIISNEGVAKIMDFGIARHQSQPQHANIHDSQTMPGEFIGSPGSLSPEQATGEPLTTSSDLFSFGILAFSLLCGHHPFGDTKNADQLLHSILYRSPFSVKFDYTHREETQGEVDKEADGILADLILQCLNKNPKHRPSAEAVVSVLETPSPRQPAATFVAQNNTKKENWVSTAIATGAVLLLIALVALWAGQTLGVKARYLVVLKPELTQSEATNPELIPLLVAAMDNTIQEALLSQPDTHLIDRQEWQDLSDLAEIGKKTGASEIIKPRIRCTESSCTLTLEKFSATDASVTARKNWEVLIEVSTDIYYSTWQNTLALIDSAANAPTDIENTTYLNYLALLETYSQKTWLTQDDWDRLEKIVNEQPDFIPAQRLLANSSVANFYATNDSKQLASYKVLLEKNLNSLNEITKAELTIEILLALKQFDLVQSKVESLRKLGATASYYELKAKLALALNQFEEAKSQYLNLLKVRKSAKYLYNLAYCDYALGNSEGATQYLTKLLNIAPKDTRAINFLAGIAMSEGNYPQAIEAYNKLVADDPHPIHYGNLAIAKMLSGDFESALLTQQQSIALAPKEPKGLISLGEIYLGLNKYNDAELQFTQALKYLKASNDISDLIVRATANIHLGNITEAKETIHQANLISKGNTELVYAEALYYTTIDDSEQALAKMHISLNEGYSIDWFAFPWFARLCSAESYRNLLNEAGRTSPCPSQNEMIIQGDE